jgi:hypothetical protein
MSSPVRKAPGGALSDSATRKKGRRPAVLRRLQPIGAWNAVVELGKAAQKRQMRPAPIDDIVMVVAVCDRPAHRQEQNPQSG